jgi:virginiamycin B lyase
MRCLLVSTTVVIAMVAASCSSESSPATEAVVASTTSESTTDPPATRLLPAPATAPPTTDSEGLPSAQRIADVTGVTPIDARPNPDWITIAGGAAWVANVSSGVVGYDLSSAASVADLPFVGDVCMAMDSTADSLFAGDCGATTLVRINVADRSIAATVSLPFAGLAEESSIAASNESVWVMSSRADLQIARIDQATNAVTDTFAAPSGASAMRFTDGSLWVSDADHALVHRLEPTTGAEQASIEVDAGARFMAVGEGGLWVMNNTAGTVSFIDPSTNAVNDIVVVSEYPIDGGDIAVGGGFVWARVSDVAVAQIDPATMTVIARYGPSVGSGSVAADRDAVWISAHDVTTVWRVPLG